MRPVGRLAEVNTDGIGPLRAVLDSVFQ